MKLGVHVTAYRRPTITKIAFTCLRRILDELAEQGVDSHVVVGCSEKKSAGIAKAFGFEPFMVKNDPLGHKFNETAKYLHSNYDWDYMLEYCSDNVMEQRYTSLLLKQIEADTPYWAMNCFYMMNWRTKEVRVYSPSGWSNVGRLTRRDLVDKLYGKRGYIFNPRLGRRLDKDYNDDMFRMCRVIPSFPALTDPIILDLKDDVSLNQYKSFAAKGSKYPVVSLAGNFPEINGLEKVEKNGTDNR
jgi:hypothetical protein